MNSISFIEDYLSGQSTQVQISSFVLSLILAIIASYLLGVLYARYGQAVSNRRALARNFVLVTMTTMLIITIVKSSLALSLGLVGALSIVRFRAAIKEPEELIYLYLAIGLGLGLGADQAKVTLVAFAVIATTIWAKSRLIKKGNPDSLYMTITSNAPDKVSLEKIVERLRQYCAGVNLRRFDETEGMLEVSVVVDFQGFENLNEAKRSLRDLDRSLQITFLDTRGMP